jgi:RNA polymerase sigma-70 factor (ECF subfamily)
MQADAPDGSRPDEDTRLLVASCTDPHAYADFYTRNSNRILGWFYRRTLCRHTSGELTAEAFARGFGARRRFDPGGGGSAVAWLFGICGNLLREWQRSAVVSDKARRKLGIVTPVVTEDDLAHLDDMIDLSTMRTALQDALAQLSPKVREAILLRVALDLPYDVVAEQLGCTVGAARVRVSRGLEHLSPALDLG